MTLCVLNYDNVVFASPNANIEDDDLCNVLIGSVVIKVFTVLPCDPTHEDLVVNSSVPVHLVVCSTHVGWLFDSGAIFTEI